MTTSTENDGQINAGMMERIPMGMAGGPTDIGETAAWSSPDSSLWSMGVLYPAGSHVHHTTLCRAESADPSGRTPVSPSRVASYGFLISAFGPR